MTARWNVDMGPETSAWQGTKKAGALGLVSSQLTKRVRRSLLIFFFAGVSLTTRISLGEI